MRNWLIRLGNFRKFYSPEGAYGNSKAAQIMFTRSLERQFKDDDCNVKAVAIHPGVVRTGLYEHARFVHLVMIYHKQKLHIPLALGKCFESIERVLVWCTSSV